MFCCRGQRNSVLCFLQSIEAEDPPQDLLLFLESPPKPTAGPAVRVTHQQIWWEALEEGLKTPGILEDQHQIVLFSHSSHGLIIPRMKDVINSCVSGCFLVLMPIKPLPWLWLHRFELWDETCHSYTHSFAHALQAHTQLMPELPALSSSPLVPQ